MHAYKVYNIIIIVIVDGGVYIMHIYTSACIIDGVYILRV